MTDRFDEMAKDTVWADDSPISVYNWVDDRIERYLATSYRRIHNEALESLIQTKERRDRLDEPPAMVPSYCAGMEAVVNMARALQTKE